MGRDPGVPEGGGGQGHRADPVGPEIHTRILDVLLNIYQRR